MADYAPAWGTHCDDGGFILSNVLSFYESPDTEQVIFYLNFLAT
jgi:hypothetical protein